MSLLVNLVPEKYHASRFVEIMRKLEQLVRSLASGSPVIGGSANSVIYVDSAGNINAADADIQFNGTQLQLPVQGNTGGVRIGTDVDLYRSAANTLTIPDSVTITGTATLGSTAYPGTYASGDILIASALNTLSALAKGSDTQVLTLASGLPSWAAIPPLTIGSPVSLGGANRVLYQDSSQNLAATDNFKFNGARIELLQSDGVLIASERIFRASTSTMGISNALAVGTYVISGNNISPFDTGFIAQGNGGSQSTILAPLSSYLHTGTSLDAVLAAAQSNGNIRFYSELTERAVLTGAGQFQVPTTGSSAGLLVGGDALWYRSSADTWRTPDNVTMDGVVTIGSTVYPGTFTPGDIAYASATNTLSKLPVGSNGEVLTLVAGLPSWEPTGLSDHLADTADAHDASAISVLDAGGLLTATDVEAALAEIATDIDNHIADATAAHAATAVSFSPAGGIAAITVQAAIQELDTEKQPLDGGLTDIAALAVTDGNIIVGDGANWVAESGATARASLGLTIGTHVQAWSSNLDEYSAVNPTVYGLTLVALADETALEATLDTLPNLVSVQGLTVTLADAGADAVLGWDDSAGAYENLTASEVLDIIKTVDGSGSGLDADLLDGNSSAFFATATGLSDHLADPTAAHAATAVSFAPAGGIAAITVQAAIEELDTEKQPLDGGLTDIAGLAVTDGNIIVGDGANWVAESGATARASLGLTIGTHVQAWSANLDEYSAVNPTVYGLSLVALADETALEATLDTLPNLVSVQGLTVTLADAGADAFLGWDDSAAAYENLTKAEAQAVLGLVAVSVDNTVPRFDSTAGNQQTSGVTISDGDVVTASGFVGPLTGNVTGDVSGNAGTVTTANEATDTSCFITFTTAASGPLPLKTNANLTLNSNTGVVTFASAVLTTVDINGGTADAVTIGATTPAAITGTTITATGVVTVAAGSAANPAIIFSGSATSGIYQPAADQFGISLGGVVRWAMSSANNMIGTDTSYQVSSSVSPALQIHGATTSSGTVGMTNWNSDSQAPRFDFCKSASGSIGSHTVVANSDDMMVIRASGSNGTNFQAAVQIVADVDGAPGAAIPGRLVFFTTTSGSTTLTEVMRMDSTQRVLAGPTTPLTIGQSNKVQIAGNATTLSGLSISHFAASAVGPSIQLSKSRSGTTGTNTIAQSGDSLGDITWYGADGTNYDTAAQIIGELDGTPTSNGTDMPGRILFKTSADGSATLTERMRIDKAGNVVVNTAAIATNATDGFLYVPTCAGTPTGTPTTYTGMAPIVVNTTNNKLYFYSGGAWRDAGP